MPDIDIGWKVKLDELATKLRESGAMANSEVTKVIAGLNKEFKKAEKAAGNAAKNAAKEWDNKIKGITESSKKVLTMVGGDFAKMGELIFELGPKATTAAGALGGIGAAAVASVVAVAAIAGALYEVAAAAEAAEKRLTEAGHAAQLPPGAAESIEKYRDGMASLRTEADVLAVTLGDDLAGHAGVAAASLGYLLDRALAVKDAISSATGSLVENAQFGARVLAAVSTLGVSELARFVRGNVEANAEAHAQINQNEADSAKALEKYAERSAKALAAVEEARAAAAIKGEKTTRDTIARASKAVQATVPEADLTPTFEINAGDLEQRNALLAKIAAQDAAAAEARLQQLRLEADAVRAVQSAEEMAASAGTIRLEGMRQLAENYAGFTVDLSSGVANLTRIAADNAAKAAENGSERQKRVAMQAFRATKAVQIAAATAESIRAGISLIPSYAFLGVGAYPAAAATAALSLASAIASINSIDPPSFQRGGMVDSMARGTTPDHRLVQARPDEGILTGRGVDRIGGPAALDALNRGGTIGQPVTVNLVVDGRKTASHTIDRLDALTSGRPPLGRRAAYG
jgi:hypothetical protein